MSVTLLWGDAEDKLTSLQTNSVDSLVTDPPYGLSKEPDITEVLRHWMAGEDFLHNSKGFMGKSWDSFVPGPSLWKVVFRVMKPGAHGLVFAGTRTVDLMGISLRFAGFEIRDTVQWVYGSGFPKSMNIEKKTDDPRWRGWGTALKPACEPIILIRKPLGEKTIAANVLKWGVGGLNIDECRVGENPGYKYNTAKNGTTFHGEQGSRQKSTVEKAGKQFIESTKGRWPANVIHDGSEEVEEGFPESKSCDSPSKAKPEGTIFGGRRSQGALYPGERGSASRFFYCAKTSKRERNKGLPEGFKNDHPTVKPLSLMEYLVKLITPSGGVVLDPFMGSGTTGMACVKEEIGFVGVEKDKRYYIIARRRIHTEGGQWCR